MGAAAWLVGWRLRRRWAGLLPIGLLTAAGVTGTLVSIGAAERTDSAYARYAGRSAASDLIINPSLITADADRLIRSLPGVERVTIDAMFFAAVIEGELPETWAEAIAHDDGSQVRGAIDGHYLTSDRPAIAAGRLPTGQHELFANAEYAARRGWDIGDELALVLVAETVAAGGDPTAPFEPLAVEPVTLVGTGTFPDEVLDDELFPFGAKLLVSENIARQYHCEVANLAPGDLTEQDLWVSLFPSDCASTYTYWALDLVDGAAGVHAATEAFVAGAAHLNAALPETLLANGAGYFLIPTTTSEAQIRVERSLQPIVTALYVLGGVAGIVTLAALALLLVRDFRRSDSDQRSWRQLGLPAGPAALVLAVPALVAVGAGLVVGVGAAWLASPIAPVGSARLVEPNPGLRFSVPVAVAAAVLAALAALMVWLAARHAARQARLVRQRIARAGPVARLAARAAPPDVATGVRAAYSGSGAGVVVASCALAIALLLAAAVFGANFGRVLGTPGTYGWPWDAAIMGGYGYGALDLEAVESALAAEPEIEAVTRVGLLSDVVIDGQPTAGIVLLDPPAGGITIASGRMPVGPDELALGARTAAGLGVDVGDTVAVSGVGLEPRGFAVTAIAVVPPLGAYQSERAGPGDGAVLPAEAFSDAPAWLATTFVGLDLAVGADAAAIVDRLSPVFAADGGSTAAVGHAEPARPPEIIDARSARSVPIVVGGLLAGAAVLGLTFAVALSIRARRTELGVLRALGSTGAEVRRSVRVQAIATMAAALVVGVPLGVGLGRWTWRAYADQLGVVPHPSVPWWWVGAVVVGALGVVTVASALPARAASRERPGAALRGTTIR